MTQHMPVLYRNKTVADAVARIKSIGYSRSTRCDFDVLVEWWTITGGTPRPTGLEVNLVIPIDVWKRDWSIYKPGDSW